MIKQKKHFKLLLKRNFRISSQIYSIDLKKLDQEPLEKQQPPTDNKETYKIFETVKIEAKSNPIRTFLGIIALIVAIIAFINKIPWTPKKSIPLFSTDYEPLLKQKIYFPRNKIEKKIEDLLNKSQLIIVYGPKISGKSTTVDQVLKGRKGVIPVSYQKETNLKDELGRVLEIPNEKRSLNMVKTIFQEFKKVYGSYPIIHIEINGQYHSDMEQWVRDGRHLTEGGKGVCDCTQ
jgi:hypothetical protein